MYQHHIMLSTPEPIDTCTANDWYKAVKTFGPEGVVYTYTIGDNDIGMEYGIRDDEFAHCYIVPLKRDLTPTETQIIVAAWEYMFDADFDIEISNQYSVDQEYEIDIDEATATRAAVDMKKWHHNRWVSEMTVKGWRYGTYFSESNKTHPALRDWDSLPESYRRSPDFDKKEITEWLRRLI
jgi:hypothetical protein